MLLRVSVGRARAFGTLSMILHFDNRQIAGGTRFREIFTAPTRVELWTHVPAHLFLTGYRY